MEDTFIVILGDVGNRHFQSMISNMQSIGNYTKILDNVYVLESKEATDYENVRNVLSGSDGGYCIVIAIEGLKAAWNIVPSKSQFLQSFFNKLS